MMRRIRAILMTGVVALVATTSCQEAQRAATPSVAEPVDDAAAPLGPFGFVVRRLCRAMRSDLGIDVRVATRRGGNEEIAALAERSFRELRVGEGAAAGGILILLDSENERARIEVSYSLEGSFPDVFLSRLARDQLVPYVSHRAAGMAVMDVLHFLRTRALDAAAAGEIQPTSALAGAAAGSFGRRSGGGGAQVYLPDAPSHLEFKRRVPDERRALYAPSADPQESVAAFRRARRDLVGDPTLELFTAGSRVMRARYPVAPFEEALRAQALERVEKLELRVSGDFAVAAPTTPAPEVPPILLVREGGLWRIDLVETFKLFFWHSDGKFWLQSSATPYAAFFPDQHAAYDASLSAIGLDGESLEAAIARLERGRAPSDRFALAEILMRNCFVSSEAMSLYEEAARADARFAIPFAQRAVRLGMPEAAIELVEQIGPSAARWAAWLHESAGDSKLAQAHYVRAIAWNPRDSYSREALSRLEGAQR